MDMSLPQMLPVPSCSRALGLPKAQHRSQPSQTGALTGTPNPKAPAHGSGLQQRNQEGQQWYRQHPQLPKPGLSMR